MWEKDPKFVAPSIATNFTEYVLLCVLDHLQLATPPKQRNTTRQSLALLTFATSASVRVDEIGMASAISVCERGHVWQQHFGSTWSTPKEPEQRA